MPVDEILSHREVEDRIAVIFDPEIRQRVRDYWARERAWADRVGLTQQKKERAERNKAIQCCYEAGWDLYDLQIRFKVSLNQLQKIVGSKKRRKR